MKFYREHQKILFKIDENIMDIIKSYGKYKHTLHQFDM